MSDPFQNVDAAGDDFVSVFATTMDIRQAEPTMERVVAAYLGQLGFSEATLTVENGCGAGAVTRRIAEATPGRVIGYDLSEKFIEIARGKTADLGNVTFAATGGAPLPHEDGTVDHVIMHTLLTHVVDPQPMVDDAARVLRPGGKLVICDGDFSKGTLRCAPNDPLGACSDAFVDEFVTDAFISAKLRPMARAAGLEVESFALDNRVVADNDSMMSWVSMTSKNMVERGEIGQPLADALVAEYTRRRALGELCGFQAFATLIAAKPA